MKDAPRRIQRKRTPGFKLPDSAVVVTRPTKWGNPFTMTDPKDVRERDRVVDQYEMWLTHTREGMAIAAAARRELRGKDLACWCPLDQPCHADVLLRVANGGLP